MFLIVKELNKTEINLTKMNLLIDDLKIHFSK